MGKLDKIQVCFRKAVILKLGFFFRETGSD